MMNEVIYYWYHHMIDSDVINDIQDTIDSHDYEKFMAYYNYLNSNECTFLPDYAYIFVDDDYFSKINIIDSPEIFSKITYSECECG